MDDYNNQTLAGYDSTVQKYIATSPQKVEGHLKAWIDKILHDMPTDSRILEIGSGSGKDADYFASQGYAMELTDGSKGFVDYLNSVGKKARILNILTDDIEDGYDMIFADAVFLHFQPEQLRFILSKIHSALKNKGRIAFSLKAGSGDEITSRKLEVPRYFHYWNENEIKQLLQETGFQEISITIIDDYRGKTRPDWLLIDARKQE